MTYSDLSVCHYYCSNFQIHRRGNRKYASYHHRLYPYHHGNPLQSVLYSLTEVALSVFYALFFSFFLDSVLYRFSMLLPPPHHGPVNLQPLSHVHFSEAQNKCHFAKLTSPSFLPLENCKYKLSNHSHE